jgi:hypothetical protein
MNAFNGQPRRNGPVRLRPYQEQAVNEISAHRRWRAAPDRCRPDLKRQNDHSGAHHACAQRRAPQGSAFESQARLVQHRRGYPLSCKA